MANTTIPVRSIYFLQKAKDYHNLAYFSNTFFFFLLNFYLVMLAKAQQQEVNTKYHLRYHQHKAESNNNNNDAKHKSFLSVSSKMKLVPLQQLNTAFLTNIQLDSVHTFCFMSLASLCLKTLKVGFICRYKYSISTSNFHPSQQKSH